jgi:hypothetical protein
MRHSTKLEFLIVLGASFAFFRCSGDDSTAFRSTGAGGTPAGAAGSSSTGTNGTSSTASTGGSAGNAGSSGGSAGSGATGGSAGAGGAAGATGGSGGGADAGKTDGAAGSAADASRTDGAEGGPVNCPDELVGANDAGTGDAGASDAGATTTAIVLIDNVVIRDAANTNVVAQWQFDDATTIDEALADPRAGDKWSRPPFSPIDTASAARNTFLACDGNPAAGSMKEVIPFTDAAQYYEVSVLFAEHDYSSFHVSAKVKLVTGGRSDASCPAHALLYGIDGGDFVQTPAAPITLVAGQWQDVTLTIPATGFARMDELGMRITTYVCL